MIGKRLPGERSNITLLISSTWAILGLFVLIIGHLTLVFFAYGEITNTDTISELAVILPVLTQTHLYIVAGLAIVLDIWIYRSHKNQRQHHIQR